MTLACFPVAGKQKSVDLCNAFKYGTPAKATGAVFYGVNSSNIDAWRRAKRSGQDWFYMDNSYFDKTRVGMDLSKPGYFRITKNRFQVDPLTRKSTGNRFAALGIEVAQMHNFSKPGYCLAVEQSPAFMSDIADDPTWLDTRIELSVRLGIPVEFRAWSADKPKLMQTLGEAMRGAKCVLTHSSAAAVEATLAGVHTVVSPMSAMHGVTSANRLRVFDVLADNQWTLDEIRNGKAWSWLEKN